MSTGPMPGVREQAADGPTLVLAGDVMIGRGIDQIMRDPLPPVLHEPWVHDARDYVRLAEKASGPIPAPVPPEYVWGDALAAMDRLAPDLRIVNLETAVTREADPWPGKGIHYRTSPAHVDALAAARIDACSLANNHVLDWGREGLRETLSTLQAAGIQPAGAGADVAAAQAAASLRLPQGGRLLLSAWAAPGCGVPGDWAAAAGRNGVAQLPALDEDAARHIAEIVHGRRERGDIAVVSLHWGDNWVDTVPAAHRWFARRLVELGAADIVHGHSSHHPLPIEVYEGRLILYGCGDLINDYEGIAPRRRQRSDLACLYAATLDRSSGRLQRLALVPMQLRRFRLTHPSPGARQWLERQLQKGCLAFGTQLQPSRAGDWLLRWH